MSARWRHSGEDPLTERASPRRLGKRAPHDQGITDGGIEANVTERSETPGPQLGFRKRQGRQDDACPAQATSSAAA
jgi:hypothetical protein